MLPWPPLVYPTSPLRLPKLPHGGLGTRVLLLQGVEGAEGVLSAPGDQIPDLTPVPVVANDVGNGELVVILVGRVVMIGEGRLVTAVVQKGQVVEIVVVDPDLDRRARSESCGGSARQVVVAVVVPTLGENRRRGHGGGGVDGEGGGSSLLGCQRSLHLPAISGVPVQRGWWRREDREGFERRREGWRARG